jgi:hypothetical protein
MKQKADPAAAEIARTPDSQMLAEDFKILETN